MAAGALIGPAQVAARIFEASFLSRYHPLVSTRLACLTHPIGAAIVGLVGGGAASVFAVFHGTGNGILTIARGTLPLAIFGPQNYGYRLGIIGAPARMAQAARATGVQPLDRRHGQPRPDRLVGAEPLGAAGAVLAEEAAGGAIDWPDGLALPIPRRFAQAGSLAPKKPTGWDLRRNRRHATEFRSMP